MDLKGFDRLQTAVQWTVDEDRERYEFEKTDEYAKFGWDAWWTQSVVHHDQESWGAGVLKKDGELFTSPIGTYTAVCPTAGCLAGNVVLASGEKFVVSWPSSQADHIPEGLPVSVSACWTADGDVDEISHRAQELMGIDSDDADRLFEGENDVDAIVNIATEIAASWGFTLEIK